MKERGKDLTAFIAEQDCLTHRDHNPYQSLAVRTKKSTSKEIRYAL